MKEQNNSCLSKAQISEFLDRPDSLDAAQRQHLEQCEHCQKLLNEYKTIGLAVEKATSANTLLELGKFRHDVYAKISSGGNEDTFFDTLLVMGNRGWRIAAAFIFAAILLFFAFAPSHETLSVNNGEKTGSARSAVSPGDIRLLAEKLPYYPIGQGDFNYGSDALPLEVLQSASLGNDSEPLFMGPRTDPQVHVIDDYVNHVWVCKSLSNCRGKVEKIIDQLKIPPEAVRISESGNNRLDLALNLTRRQLVYLVRRCEKAGLSLLSSQSPQPEQRHFAGQPDQVVSYHAKFVLQQ